jgi:hypothetical protein
LNLNVNTLKILKAVPFANGFHFFTDNVEYTEIIATILIEFEEKLKIVSV